MSEWWTYSLSDFLLFSPRTYYRLFELYNVAIWPAQILTLALGVAILVLWRRGAGRAIAPILAACWLWVAWAYLLTRYDTINWAARYFAIGFAVEAALLVWIGVVRDRLLLLPETRMSRIGLGMFVFALAVQPLVGPLVGRGWLQAEIFGVAPDPTAVATLGIVLAAARPLWGLLVIPLVWCAISGATLWTMQAPDALLMPVVAVFSLVLAVWRAIRSVLKVGS
jgi:hypothetical protein